MDGVGSHRHGLRASESPAGSRNEVGPLKPGMRVSASPTGSRDEVGSLKPGMRASASPRRAEWVAELACRQHGVVAYRQLRAIGLSSSAIDRAVRGARLHRLYKGVYAVGHPVLTRHGRWMAAVLACGPGAALSHRDAAALHEIRRDNRQEIDVSAPRSRHQQHGITLHRPRRLHAGDLTTVDGIPVSTVARTLLDLAALVNESQLERAVEETELRKLFDMNAVEATLARSKGHRGAPRLEAAVADLRPFIPMTRSEFERAFPKICRDAGLPQPAMNVWLLGYEVDALFEEDRIVVELDGGEYHATTAARRRDPIRDARLQAAGYRIVRVHERWLADAPEAIRALMRTSRRSA